MEDDKQIFLERQWKLLDGNKKLRINIPTIISSLNIVIGSFYFKSILELKKSNWLFAIIVLFITIFGVWALRTIQKQYNYSNSKVTFLYDKFKIDYLKDFTKSCNEKECISNSKHETGLHLFFIGYISIILIGGAIFIGIFIPN